MDSNLAQMLERVYGDPDPGWVPKSLRAVYTLLTLELEKRAGLTKQDIDLAFRKARNKVFRSNYSRRHEPDHARYMSKEFVSWYAQRLLAIHYERKLSKILGTEVKLEWKVIDLILQPVLNHVPEHLRNGVTGHFFESTEYWYWLKCQGFRYEEEGEQVEAGPRPKRKALSLIPETLVKKKRRLANPMSRGKVVVQAPNGLASPPITPESQVFASLCNATPIPFNLPLRTRGKKRREIIDLTQSPPLPSITPTHLLEAHVFPPLEGFDPVHDAESQSGNFPSLEAFGIDMTDVDLSPQQRDDGDDVDDYD